MNAIEEFGGASTALDYLRNLANDFNINCNGSSCDWSDEADDVADRAGRILIGWVVMIILIVASICTGCCLAFACTAKKGPCVGVGIGCGAGWGGSLLGVLIFVILAYA